MVWRFEPPPGCRRHRLVSFRPRAGGPIPVGRQRPKTGRSGYGTRPTRSHRHRDHRLRRQAQRRCKIASRGHRQHRL